MSGHVYVSKHVLTISRPIFMMPMVLSMAILHSLGHNDQNDMKHLLFSQLIPLLPALLSKDANCIINGIISSLGVGNLNKAWQDFWSCYAAATILWALHGIVNDTILFARWRWLKQGATRLFVMWHQCWHHMTLMAPLIPPLHLFAQVIRCNMNFFSHLILGTSISIMWCQWHCQ